MNQLVRFCALLLAPVIITTGSPSAASERKVRLFKTSAGYRVTAQLPGSGNRYEFVFKDQSAPGHWRGAQRRRKGHAQSPWHGAALSAGTISPGNGGFSLYLLDRRRFRPVTVTKSASGNVRVTRARSSADRACALSSASFSLRELTSQATPMRLNPPRELAVFVVSEAGGVARGIHTARELLNAADALYSSQLGLRLKMAGYRGLSSAAPPSESLDQTLEQFRSDAPSRSWFGSANAYLLITGPRANRDVIGLSYLGYLCRDQGLFSFSTAQRVEAPLQPLLIAHELAHLFGVRHDSAPRSLMQARIGAGSSTLSDQSRATLSQYVTEHGGCLPEAPDTAVSLQAAAKSRSATLTVAVETDEPGACAVRIVAGSSAADVAQQNLSGAVTVWEGGVASDGSFSPTELRFSATGLSVPRAGVRLFARAFASCGDGRIASSQVVTLIWPGTGPNASRIGFDLRFVQRLALRLRRLR
jgi:Metallo-peptidase family M12